MDKIDTDILVKLSPLEIRKLGDGKLLYTNHPIKGSVRVNSREVYVSTISLKVTDEELDKLLDLEIDELISKGKSYTKETAIKYLIKDNKICSVDREVRDRAIIKLEDRLKQL